MRESSRMFRSEATSLPLMTHTLTPHTDNQYHLGLRNDPHFKGNINSPRLFRTDKDGTVINNIPAQNTSPKNTILFLGGSTTECNEVDEEYRFPTLVGSILTKETNSTYRGINLGVRGNTSHDSINLLLNHPSTDQAEIVVLMNNINDRLFLANRRSYKAPLSHEAPTKWNTVIASSFEFIENLWNYLSYRSNLLFLVNTRLFSINSWTGEKNLGVVVNEDAIDFPDPDYERSAQKFRRSLIVFIKITRSLNKYPILMTQALGRKSTHQKKFNDIVRMVALETETHLIDLEKLLSGKTGGLFLSDDIHLNNEGARAIAQIIAGNFKTELLGLETTYENSQGSFDLSKCLAPSNVNINNSSVIRRQLIPRSGRYPVFSPNERYLLFQRWTGSKEVVEMYDQKTKLHKRLSNNDKNVEERHAVFLPDAENEWQIVYGRKENEVEQLFTKGSNNDKAKPILDLMDLSGSIPAVGKNQNIYFAGSKIDSEGRFLGAPDLYHYNLKTKITKNLTKTKWEEWRPAPDPSGKFIYYIANPHGQFDIYRLDVDSGVKTLFYGSEADEWDPDISRDGKWIVFASRKNGNWDIFLASTNDSRKLYQLTSGISDDWDPKFTPLSNAIIFASSKNEKPPFMYYLCPFGEAK